MQRDVGDFVIVHLWETRNGELTRGNYVNAIVVEVVAYSNRPTMYRCVYDNGTESYGTELTAGVHEADNIDDNQKNTLVRLKNLYDQNNEGHGKKKKSKKSKKSRKSRKSRK